MTAKKKKAKLVLLRHGQTHYNIGHLMTGRHDAPLTPKGEEQAAAAGVLIRHLPIDKVYSSSLSRAFNTAALALKSAGKDLHIEKRHEIVETDAGDFTGRCYTTDPEILAHDAAYGRAMPNGESDKDVVKRVRKFFEDEVLPRLERGENVMVVAHYGVACAFDIILGLVPEPADGQPCHAARVPNAAPAVYHYEDGVMQGYTYIENAKSQPRAPEADNQNDKKPAPRRRRKGPQKGL
ncbi:MAG: histidine phosphatase family protein [Alphaproteobacteria bacterium]|nr:histidine phosphatase family protein [Alphaproteobacteria bacterium]